MRFFKHARDLSFVLLPVCALGCEPQEQPTNPPWTPWTQDAAAVVGTPNLDAGAQAVPSADAASSTPEAGAGQPEAGAQQPDAAAPIDAGGPGLDATVLPADAGASQLDGAGPSAEGGLDGEGGAGPQPDSAVGSPEGGMPGTVPIPPPLADNCITSVSPGDHTFTCQGVSFSVMVDERCTKFSCGLIFDVHGAAMSGDDMRNNDRLHQLAPSKGYLTVHPSAPDLAWDWQTHPPILVDFMSRMIKAFHVDEKRVHMTGFSMGSGMTFWFLCNHREVLASVAPVTGSSAQQVTAPNGAPCIESIDASWKPRVPILFMSGRKDTALTIEAARARAEGIVSRLELTGGEQVAGDATFSRKRWQGADGMVFDFLEHDYENWLLAGHCIPGGVSGDLFGCDGPSSLNWGQVALQWFIDHPKR